MSSPVVLADLTTFRCGGPAARHTTVTSADELVAAVMSADAAGESVLLVGGGSNMLVGPEALTEHVIVVRSEGIVVDSVDAEHVLVTVQAGVVWDDFVAHCVARGWSGVEALSGIPGSVGATPIQNVGAYGQEVSHTIVEVQVLHRPSGERRVVSAQECLFAYRDSVFKQNPGQFVVLAVRFRLSSASSSPVQYGQLASALGVAVGEHADPAQVRASVLALRAGKAMVLDSADHDTWSAGSFFTNPIVPHAVVPDDAPKWPVDDELSKTSAAWLIDHAGFGKGFGLPGKASLSTKHTLALTNRGEATAVDVLALAAQVRDGVFAKYGIELVPEPNLIHCELLPVAEGLR